MKRESFISAAVSPIDSFRFSSVQVKVPFGIFEFNISKEFKLVASISFARIMSVIYQVCMGALGGCVFSQTRI